MSESAKKMAGEKAAEYVQDGHVVGLGTGSTAYFAIVRLAEMVADGLSIRGIPTSESSAELARERHIPLIDFSEAARIDVTIDGADEIDGDFNLIKGGGGALLREKIVAAATSTQIIVADDSKVKKTLGAFPLPVETTSFGWDMTRRHIEQLGCQPQIRSLDGEAFVTDNGNLILDCPFECIDEPGKLESELRSIPGVVECGLFVGLTNKVVLGNADGSIQELS